MTTKINLALIGFGEAGKAFAKGWPREKCSISAYDIKFQDDESSKEAENSYIIDGISRCASAAEAVYQADAIFSFVTASQAHEALCNVAGDCKSDALFFDCNSCAPDTKRRSAKTAQEYNLRYIDAAVMAPVYPALHKTKIYICGPHADAALHLASALDMNVEEMAGEIGISSGAKMVRSVMMKGLEAVMVECVLAGRKAGVDEFVLASLDKTYPGFQFEKKAAYMMERVMIHGIRRAEEMREVATTLNDLNLSNPMSRSAVEWQQKIGELMLDPDYTLDEADYKSRADIILKALEEPQSN